MKKEEKLTNRDYKIIKNFSKISIAGICRKLNVNRSNVINGDAKKEDIKRVKEEIESELAKLYIKE